MAWTSEGATLGAADQELRPSDVKLVPILPSRRKQPFPDQHETSVARCPTICNSTARPAC
jgi:hypothetical protein